ncbi:MAG: 23S rRNA (adenine(2503)-C(2))-methyltransferase RlmN [Chloroflexi bacterium]|nr:23S rRNA (adenine(2503)-C(2))-methyltransferase RlmN [Chloroflexota bacterium]
MAASQGISLYELDFPGLESLIQSWGERPYRARQLWHWLYAHHATGFNEMLNLPQALRQRLQTEAVISSPSIVETAEAGDGETRKDLLQLQDGETIETVLMYYERRRTACISTQVGCPVGCTFCATGQMGFRRNLTVGEIVVQVLHFARVLSRTQERLTNVVLMGMGEPLLNYDASLAAVRRITAPEGLNIGQRHVTISTVGVIPGIDRLADEQGATPDTSLQVTLAVSLHAATDELREQIVPINRQYPLDSLFAACRRYAERTGRRITFEWALIHNLNDSIDQAEALIERLSDLPAHVNLIRLNPTERCQARPPERSRVKAFADTLDRHGISVTVRLRRGIDIGAGCGQLRQRGERQSGVQSPRT